MTDCRSVEPLLAPYVDGEAGTGDVARVESHLAECPPCRQRVREERSVRQALRSRGRFLVERAPLELRARCARMIPGAGAPPVVAAASWSRRGWLAAAAALVLAGAGVAAWGVSSTSVLAAGLALDHLKCFAWFEPAEPPPSPDAVAAGLHAAYGWRITVPPDAPAERLRLLGGRRCFSTGGAAAHILYLHGGRPLSLYMVPGSDRAEATLALAGYQAVVWSKNHVTYVVLGHEGGEDLSRVAAYLKAASSR